MHEWNDAALVAAIGALRRRGAFHLLFHDTHHRAVSDPEAIRAFDLTGYDGVLAFGQTLADVYAAGAGVIACGPGTRRPTPACSTRPRSDGERAGLVWIGNWGDGERTREIEDFLLRPAAEAGLRLDIYGVRYPDKALAMLAAHEARYRGWAPNARCRRSSRKRSPPSMCHVGYYVDDPARHPHHPRVRVSRLRPAARLRAMGRCRAAVSPRHRLPGRRQWRSDDGASPSVAEHSARVPRSRPRGSRRSAPDIPARTASTSCSRSSPCSTRAPVKERGA